MVRFKKLTAVVLAAAMVCSMAGCGGKKETPSEETTEPVATQNDASETEEPSEEASEESTEQQKLEDGQVIFDINFDDGDRHGFTEYSNGGNFTMAVEDGQLVVDIASCGMLDYANQVYMDGFALSKGCVYTYSFDISCDIERTLEWRLQINGGDYHAYVGDVIEVGPETSHVTLDFEHTEDSDPAPRLCFNMGKQENMASDPGKHKVYIDNLSLVVKDASNAETIEALPENPKVNVSQVGYKTTDVKTVISADEADTSFQVINKDTGEVALEGTYEAAAFDAATNANVKHGDFSSLTEPGTYYIVSGDNETYEFTVSDDVYEDIYKDIVIMLYNQRCGIELDSAISGDFAHGPCHTGEAVVYGTNEKKDVSGGWHDAGDYGRYTVSGAKTIQDLFLAYEDFGVEDDDLGIPESGNSIPDLLDEAKYELDWMLKMQDDATGGVYHKVTCLVFPETVMPEEETDQLYLAPISTTATGDFAAVMAKASVLYAEYDPDFAKKCLAAAEKAWDYIADSDDKEGFTNPEEIVTGEYPDKSTKDEVFWACSELYLATGDEKYKTAIDENLTAKVKAGQGWATVGTYAFYDLLKSDADITPETREKCQEKFDERLDLVLSFAEEDQYYMLMGTSYPWGSNMSVANNGMLLLMADKLSGSDTYSELAKRQLDYLFGANSVGYCFVTGYGTVSPVNTHHRPSQALGKTMPGMLVGGPDNALEDSYAKAVLANSAPAQCYVDNAQSYSCNEITVYWNSPLIYLLSAYK